MRRALFLVVLLLAATAGAHIGEITFEDLIRDSDLIVIATVRSVDLEGGIKVATADVIEVVSGAPKAIVRFIAQPQMRCSVATAQSPQVRGACGLAWCSTRAGSAPDEGSYRSEEVSRGLE